MVKIDTALVQLGNRSDASTGAISAPIYMSTAYEHVGLGASTGYDYSRTKNPTRTILEQGIAQLEKGDVGYACSSGMAAIQLVLQLCKAGDTIIAPTDLYGGTYRLLQVMSQQYQFNVIYHDFTDLHTLAQDTPEKVAMVFVETPTNPLMQTHNIGDIAYFAKLKDALFVVDNTFATPYFQQPLTEGAHIVVHSATKYLSGHNDVLAGLLVAKGEICERLAYLHNTSGMVLSPMDSWLLMRGMKTLHLRMRQHDANARELIQYLQQQPKVTEVLHTAKGGMLSFRLAKEAWVAPFLQALSLIAYAESLGGVESFITYPATQTHADVPYDVRVATGICNRLLRFSVGIEAVDDLIQDLDQAFANCK